MKEKKTNQIRNKSIWIEERRNTMMNNTVIYFSKRKKIIISDGHTRRRGVSQRKKIIGFVVSVERNANQFLIGV